MSQVTAKSDYASTSRSGGDTRFASRHDRRSDEHIDHRGTEDETSRAVSASLMASSLAHDINNALQAISTAFQSVDRRAALGSRQDLTNLTEGGQRAIERVARLTKRLLVFVRPGVSIRTRVDVKRLILDLQPLLRWTLGPKVVLNVHLDDDALITWCDPYDLENALMNLAINAKDAMPDGGVVALDCYRAELTRHVPGLASGKYLIVSMTDTGNGMTPDVMARAFDPFFTTKAAGDGFGVGLASVKAFVEASGGGADIVSGPAIGTTLRLYLPRIAMGAASS